MLPQLTPTLQTIDPQVLAHAMNRFVRASGSEQLQRDILKSIPSLDDWHRGALARAITNDELFADVEKMNLPTLESAVRLSSRSGELPHSFLQFLTSNPRALEQLHPRMVKGILANIESSPGTFDETPAPRSSRDFKVAASAALATLLLGGAGYAAFHTFRPNANRAAPAVAPPVYQYTPGPQAVGNSRIIVHKPARERVATRPRPIVERVFIKQVVVKQVPAKPQSVNDNAPLRTGTKPMAGPPLPRKAHPSKTIAVKHVAANRGPEQQAAATPAPVTPLPANSAPQASSAVASVPKPAAPTPAAAPPVPRAPAPPLTARDFVASTIKSAAPDSQINALWVSQGDGGTTVVEAESTTHAGTFYDKFVLLPQNGGFSITSHDQIPVSPSGEHAATASSPATAARKPRPIFGHIRRAHP